MGSEYGANMGAQTYCCGRKKLVSQGWVGSNMFKNSKKIRSGCLRKEMALF